MVLATAFAMLAAAEPVLWTDRGPVDALDLAAGPGGRNRAPEPPFLFVEEERSGTAPKIVVRDATGATWVVKFGEESKAETFASRIAWAAGYFVEPSYFLREGTIEGLRSLGPAGQFIEAGGVFRGGRFELRDPGVELLPDSQWRLEDERLKGKPELAGLKLTLMLVSNWDVKPENTAILQHRGRQYFAITDWGASMGKTGDITGRSKWDCSGYRAQSKHFVGDVADGYVHFNYAGKDRDLVANNIRVEDVQWFMNRMSHLNDLQIRSALEASGATPQETACFTGAIRERLGQLAAAATGEPVPAVTRTRTVTKTTTTVVK